MNDTLIVTIFTVLDDVMTILGHRTHPLAGASDSEVLTVATVAACQFQNHQQRALAVLRGMHYLSGALSFSRFNRRLHALAHWFSWLLDLLCDLFAFRATAFTIDSVPVPVCQRVRARRCRKVQGGEYYGYCAAKEQRFFGWRLHLICSETGVPVSYDLLPASYHDLTPFLILPKGYRPMPCCTQIRGTTVARMKPGWQGNAASNSSRYASRTWRRTPMANGCSCASSGQ